MLVELPPNANKLAGMIFAEGEQPIFQPGGCADFDAIACRTLPHVDLSPRQNRSMESVIEPAASNNEQEGFGRIPEPSATTTALRSRCGRSGRITPALPACPIGTRRGESASGCAQCP